MSLYLHVIDGTGPRQVFRLDDGLTLRVGRRHDCDISLQERSVSRQHCLLEVRGNKVRIEDTLSRNGIWLQSERLAAAVEIEAVTSLRLASARIELRDHPGIDPTTYHACTSPGRLTLFLPGQGSNRKLRLLACAWLRSANSQNGPLLNLLNKAEAFADGHINTEELSQAREDLALHAANGWPSFDTDHRLLQLGDLSARGAVQGVLDALSEYFGLAVVGFDLLALARDVLGDFFTPFQARPEWLAWNDRTVWQLARSIYDRRCFEDLPILGDALEEAGCEDTGVLQHCRAVKRHVRGCWVLDGILGRHLPLAV